MFLPVPSCVREFVHDVGFFRIICQYSFKASLSYLAYRRSGEHEWSCGRYLGRFRFEVQIGEILTVPEQQFPGEKRDYDGSLLVRALSQIDVFHRSSTLLRLNDVQDTVRMALADGDSNDQREEGHSASTAELPEQPTEEEA